MFFRRAVSTTCTCRPWPTLCPDQPAAPACPPARRLFTTAAAGCRCSCRCRCISARRQNGMRRRQALVSGDREYRRDGRAVRIKVHLYGGGRIVARNGAATRAVAADAGVVRRTRQRPSRADQIGWQMGLGRFCRGARCYSLWRRLVRW